MELVINELAAFTSAELTHFKEVDNSYLGFEAVMFLLNMGIITVVGWVVLKGISMFVSKICGNKDND